MSKKNKKNNQMNQELNLEPVFKVDEEGGIEVEINSDDPSVVEAFQKAIEAANEQLGSTITFNKRVKTGEETTGSSLSTTQNDAKWYQFWKWSKKKKIVGGILGGGLIIGGGVLAYKLLGLDDAAEIAEEITDGIGITDTASDATDTVSEVLTDTITDM